MEVNKTPNEECNIRGMLQEVALTCMHLQRLRVLFKYSKSSLSILPSTKAPQSSPKLTQHK